MVTRATSAVSRWSASWPRSTPSRTGPAGGASVSSAAGQCRQHTGGGGDAVGEHAEVVEARRERRDAVQADQAVAGFDADHAAVRSGDADRTAGVRAEGGRAHAGADEGGRPAARPTRSAVRAARVTRLRDVRMRRARGVLEQAAQREHVGSRRAQCGDRRCVLRGGRGRGRRPGCRYRAPQPATSIMSLIATGTPCSGPSAARRGAGRARTTACSGRPSRSSRS